MVDENFTGKSFFENCFILPRQNHYDNEKKITLIITFIGHLINCILSIIEEKFKSINSRLKYILIILKMIIDFLSDFFD